MSDRPPVSSDSPDESLAVFHDVTRRWFRENFSSPTAAQTRAWPSIVDQHHTLLLAPTGSGKTLAAFLVAINRIMFEIPTHAEPGVRVLYLSPLKALGVDVERNLQAPLAGVSDLATAQNVEHRTPGVAIRTGDTASRDRARMAKSPPDILITTPESLFLMLTSKVREILASVDTIIIDEIHTMVSSKRGAHLFVSLERLELMRRQANASAKPAQRIGLSATQRPLEEVARLLGGAEIPRPINAASVPPQPRPVNIIDAQMRKVFDIQIELPTQPVSTDNAATPSDSRQVPSSWSSIHPRLVELIRGHRSTMVFVNSRRLAERLAGAINDLAQEEIAAAHHGSIAHESRALIEDQLKSGTLPAIIATSSLELGIDMGAVDLVVQIEAPPSIAAGVQRVGRGGHQVGVVSRGIIIPKHRGDLLASAAASVSIVSGAVESSRYPRNPLDVLAQQIVAMVAMEALHIDTLFATVRAAAPFHELSRNMFESVLDLLAGRFPSDEFSELRARVVWDRIGGTVSPRRGAQRVAIANAGTIPDRGLYGVFLAESSGADSQRVGELDEEMVFETRPGDVFLLGASSWQVLEITHDRVLVAPAPGQPGRMPFWRGDGPGRPLEFGRQIGALSRELVEMSTEAAEAKLTSIHGLTPASAQSLLTYMREQEDSDSTVPTDRRIVVESFLDEVGDWRVVVLDIEAIWTDDGIVMRFARTEEAINIDELFPQAEEISDMVTRELANTALFASHFRESAGRALLLPKRMPGKRTPLWLQRRRAADLLAVASRFDNFPIILETYREILGDVFDLDGLSDILRDVKSRRIEVVQVEGVQASPFAAAVMFNYAGNFIYDGDVPLAERRAQALAFDFSQLRDLLGEAELRELLDMQTVNELGQQLQRLGGYRAARDADEVHDLLMGLGDLSRSEIVERCDTTQLTDASPVDRWLAQLIDRRRVLEVEIQGIRRYIACEDAGRYRDALGCTVDANLPKAFLQAQTSPLESLISRFAATRVPFRSEEVAHRFGLGIAVAEKALNQLVSEGKLQSGEFLPDGQGREWCDARVLRRLKERSLARVRKTIEPVSHTAYAQFVGEWQGVGKRRRGLDALLDVVHQLQGVPIPYSDLERAVLPARLDEYMVGDIDRLCAAGEVIWSGIDSIGASDGRIALYLTDEFPKLAPEHYEQRTAESMESRIVEALAARGALFFDDIVDIVSAFPADVLKALWNLVWAGEISNDTLAPLRSLARTDRRGRRQRASGRARAFRSRRNPGQPGTEGRWSLLRGPATAAVSATQMRLAQAEVLLERYGVLTREAVAHENISGGFSAIYPVLKQMEQAGRVRRGYFVANLGASQFALPGADDRLRDNAQKMNNADAATDPFAVMLLAACDPANPWGTSLRWPSTSASSSKASRSAGALVALLAGQAIAWLNRSHDALIVFDEDNEGETRLSDWPVGLANALKQHAIQSNGLIIKRINGQEWDTHAEPSERGQTLQTSVQTALTEAGFQLSAQGMQFRHTRS